MIIKRCFLFFAMFFVISACQITNSKSSVQRIMENGETIAFEVCGQNNDWVRPLESEQRSIWESSRYQGTEKDVLMYPWKNQFFIHYGHASISFDVINLSGLWTLPEDTWDGCLDQADAVLRWEKIEFWVLNHTVTEIFREDGQHVVVVKDVGRGVQFSQIPRQEGVSPLIIYFVDQDGVVVGEIVESDYPYWPNP